MPGRWFRTALLAGSNHLAGLGLSERVERLLAGGRALSMRSKIAHRAVMAELFRQMKRQARRR